MIRKHEFTRSWSLKSYSVIASSKLAERILLSFSQKLYLDPKAWIYALLDLEKLSVQIHGKYPLIKIPPLGKESQNLETFRISTDFGIYVDFDLNAGGFFAQNAEGNTHFQGQNGTKCPKLAFFSRLRRSSQIILRYTF